MVKKLTISKPIDILKVKNLVCSNGLLSLRIIRTRVMGGLLLFAKWTNLIQKETHTEIVVTTHRDSDNTKSFIFQNNTNNIHFITMCKIID